MWIKKKEIEQLSEFVKGYSSGEELDIRENKEGSFNILKNDIYALVNTKNEQIKAVEAERDSLSDYMADISHQLKTPITSMMIMADLLEEAEPEKQTEFIHNIQVSLNKMEWLVGALLKMAKLDAHAIDFIKNDIRTSELLEAVKPSVEILLDIHNLTIELKQYIVINAGPQKHLRILSKMRSNIHRMEVRLRLTAEKIPCIAGFRLRTAVWEWTKQSMLLFLNGLKILQMKMDLESECRLHSLF